MEKTKATKTTNKPTVHAKKKKLLHIHSIYSMHLFCAFSFMCVVVWEKHENYIFEIFWNGNFLIKIRGNQPFLLFFSLVQNYFQH
jgi:hypothetical protein